MPSLRAAVPSSSWPVPVELEQYAVEGDGRHGEVGHVGGHFHLAGLAGQQGKDNLPLAAHAGDGGAVGTDVGGVGGVQGDGGLEGVLVKPVPRTVGVGDDVDADDQRAALSRQFLGGFLDAVQNVMDLNQPGQRGGGVHGALVIHRAVAGGGHRYRVVPLGQGVGGGHVADGGVIAVVGDGVAGRGLKVVDGIDALDAAIGGQLAVDDLLFGQVVDGGSLVGSKDRQGCGAQHRSRQQCRGGAAGKGCKFHGVQPSLGTGAEAPGFLRVMSGSMR